jgi:uncharacterized coiled-coil DUF342 family protein
MDTINATKNSVNQERNVVFEKIKSIQASIKKRLDQVKSSKDKSGFKNPNEVQVHISNLEKQLSMGNLTLAEEKKIISDISSMKKSLKSFDSVTSQQSLIEADRKALEELREKLKALDVKRDESKASADAVKAKMDGVAKEMAAKAGKSSHLIEEKNSLRKKMDKAYDELKEIRATHKKAKDDFYTWLKAEQARKKAEYEKRISEEKDEKLRIAAEKELERASIPAFTDELGLCANLAAYLGGFLPDSKAAEPLNAAKTTSANGRAVDSSVPDGAIVVSKKSDRGEDFFVGKKPKKSTKRASSAPIKPFKLDLEMIDLFTRLKIEIPVSVNDIHKTLDAITAKKKWFLENQASKTLAAQEAAKARIEALKKNGLPLEDEEEED